MPWKGKNMQDYVVCEKRRSHPRIHVKICEHRCEEAETCLSFRNYKKAYVPDQMVARSAAQALSADEGLASATP
jgi:hypothetical protein